MRKLAIAIGTAALAFGMFAYTAAAQWPTTCVELNDQSEAALGNDESVGIYQKVFGENAEAHCRADHLADVQSTFSWAIPKGETQVKEVVREVPQNLVNALPFGYSFTIETGSAIVSEYELPGHIRESKRHIGVYLYYQKPSFEVNGTRQQWDEEVRTRVASYQVGWSPDTMQPRSSGYFMNSEKYWSYEANLDVVVNNIAAMHGHAVANQFRTWVNQAYSQPVVNFCKTHNKWTPCS